MPVMCIYRALDITPDIYDGVRSIIGWEAKPPPGAISHTIAFQNGSGVEVNIWESRADYEAYRDERLKPVLDQMGISIGEPDIYDIHVTAVGPPSDAYRVPKAVSPARLQPA